MNRLPAILIAFFVFFLIDLYAFQAVKFVSKNLQPDTRRWIFWAYWAVPVLSLILWVVTQFFVEPDAISRSTRQFIWTAMLIPYFAKFFMLPFMLIDDVGRFFRWIFSFFQTTSSTGEATKITRADFLMKAAMGMGGLTVVGFLGGIVFGGHRYRVRRVQMAIRNLPESFVGLKIAQISDIHSGSFYNKDAVKKGVKLLLDQKPDIVFFTGDLVNNEAIEIEPYLDVFEKITAPMGVFSILGNHDYGDYKQWDSAAEKAQNLKNLKAAHQKMGWDLLLDEHRVLRRANDEIALLGIQNWGMGGFAQYGDLAKAYNGTEHHKVKLLLSHDPSHWDAQVRPNYPDIDAMFSGHTHGMQFGVEIGGFQWSPVQFRYKQWGGLYKKGTQNLYVNRGFGYIGYPGRIGIWPEITMIELVQA